MLAGADDLRPVDALFRFFQRLPHDTATRLGAALGLAAFHLGVRRGLVRRQLSLSLGLRGRHRARVARQAYATMGANFLEVWTSGGPDGLERHTRVLNPLWLGYLHRRYRGLVFATLHLGNWEAESMAVKPHLGRVVVYAKEQSAIIDDPLTERRQVNGVEVLLARRGNRTSALEVLRCVRAGGAVGLLADQRPRPDESVAAPFLGQPAWCHPGPAFFARKLGVPVIPAFALRRRTGDHVVFIGRPLPVQTLDDAAATVRVMECMSAMIAAFPGQYFWHHDRFKKAPASAPAPDPRWRSGLRFLAGSLLMTSALFGVEDPLSVASAAVPPDGTVDVRIGASFRRQQRNFTLGGRRDSYEAPIMSVRGSPSDRVSLDVQWPVWVGMIHDPTNGSRSDMGDVTLGTTWRAAGGSHGGVLGVRSSVTLPQTDYGQGLGTDTTRWTGLLLLGWGWDRTRMDVQAGFSIQPYPNAESSKGQNDLTAWGVALSHRLEAGPTVVAEASGLQGPAGPGVGPRGDARAGLRVPLWAALTWDGALRRGFTQDDGTWGAVAGLTWRW